MNELRVTDRLWKEIRDEFSEEDKAAMRGAVIAESFCPRGFTLNLGYLPDVLSERMTKAVQTKLPAKKGGAR